MSAINAIFDKMFFINGTEGVVMLIVCIAAAMLTVAAIAMAIVVAVKLKRRKRMEAEGGSEPSQEVQTPIGSERK